MFPEKIYYEPEALSYELGRMLREKYAQAPWIEIDSHNNIPELRANPNCAFAQMKRFLVVGVRKSLAYTPNRKVSDYLTPYTSSGCSAMCLYCYLVCHYKQMRVFASVRQPRADACKAYAHSGKLNRTRCLRSAPIPIWCWRTPSPATFYGRSQHFCRAERGVITFPTKFDAVEDLLGLDHRGRVLFRMSVNPQEIISSVELGTSPLTKRIRALNRMREAGYRVGILIAPVVLVEGWRELYARMIERLADELNEDVKKSAAVEIIFMTYSFVHRAINREAFPGVTELYDPALMTGRGQGKYCYRDEARADGEAFLRAQLAQNLPSMPIVYVV